jgi:hypothetical protein
LGLNWLGFKIALYPIETLIWIFQKDSLIDRKTFQFHSISQVINQLYKYEGFRGFYRGIQYAIPGYSIQIFSYLYILKKLSI